MCVELNTDGSSLGNPSYAGFGGLIRGTASECIRGFSVHVPWANNLCVKLLALKFSLILAWQQGVRRIVCEVDCMELIRLVLHQPPTFHRYLAIISDI